MTRPAKIESSRLHMRRGRARENQTPPSTVRPLNYQSDRTATDADLIRTRLRYLRTSNLQCRNLARRNLIPPERLRILLRLSCAISCTKDTKQKRKLHCVAGAADVRPATA